MPFFRLREPRPGSSADRAGRIDAWPQEGFNIGAAPNCPRCGRYLGMLTWLPPYRLELETWGRHYGDIARTGDDLIISERLGQVFKLCGLQGLVSIEPVEVVKTIHRRRKPNQAMPRYFKATVVRSPTTIDQEASGYVWDDSSKVCPECLFDTLKRYRRQIIDASTWNGDDVFFPRGGNGPIVSERFMKAFLENGLLGAMFIPTEEDSHDFFPWEIEPPATDGK